MMTLTDPQSAKMHPAPAKVVLVVFDGCRPDALAQAHTPAVDALWQRGAYTWRARTVVPSWSLPTHLSMLRGVPPQMHGVNDNVFQASATAFPSIFDVAHQAGLKTAMFYSWEQLRDLSAHGSLDISYYHSADSTPGVDRVIAARAAEHLIAEQPDLTLVYLGETDLVGHEHGWMSPPYLAAVERMDRALGELNDALAGASMLGGMTWLLLADHGGHGCSHGTAADEDITIPWIVSGQRVRRGHHIQEPVHITDTAATIAYLLDLTPPSVWMGRRVQDALNA